MIYTYRYREYSAYLMCVKSLSVYAHFTHIYPSNGHTKHFVFFFSFCKLPCKNWSVFAICYRVCLYHYLIPYMHSLALQSPMCQFYSRITYTYIQYIVQFGIVVNVIIFYHQQYVIRIRAT